MPAAPLRLGIGGGSNPPHGKGSQTMTPIRLRSALAHVGEALREPEAFALRWHLECAPYHVAVFASLALTFIAGTTAYGIIMGLPGGPEKMLLGGLRCTAAAGIAWGLPLP